MTTYLGKSCSFGFPRVPFINCRQFMYLVISLLVLRAGCGIWLYQFLIIAYLFTLHMETLHSFSHLWSAQKIVIMIQIIVICLLSVCDCQILKTMIFFICALFICSLWPWLSPTPFSPLLLFSKVRYQRFFAGSGNFYWLSKIFTD